MLDDYRGRNPDPRGGGDERYHAPEHSRLGRLLHSSSKSRKVVVELLGVLRGTRCCAPRRVPVGDIRNEGDLRSIERAVEFVEVVQQLPGWDDVGAVGLLAQSQLGWGDNDE